MTAVPSTWPEDQPVIEPVHMFKHGRLHVRIEAHTRGDGVAVRAHYRPMPQGFAPPTPAEPVELFGGKQS